MKSLNIHTREKDKEIFNYSNIIHHAWDPVIEHAKNYYNTGFDLENNSSTGQKKTFYANRMLRKDQPIKYEINAELWKAGGDWEMPVMYFKTEITHDYGLVRDNYREEPKYVWDVQRENRYDGLTHCYVMIPPVSAGNKLTPASKDSTYQWVAYHNSELTKEQEKEASITETDEKKAWKWLEEMFIQAIAERHEMLEESSMETKIRKLIREEVQKIFEASQVSYFVDKFQRKMKGSTKSTAAWWIDGIGELSNKEKKQVWKNIQPYLNVKRDTKDDLPKWISESVDEAVSWEKFNKYPRPKRMEKPKATKGLGRRTWSNFYIGDQLEHILVDKYGSSRGEKSFNDLISGKYGNAIYSICSGIMDEKAQMLYDLGEKIPSDYYDVSYFAVWDMWMKEHSRKAKKAKAK